MTRLVTLTASGVALLFLLFSVGNLIEFVGPSEYVRIQYPSGSYSWFMTPGPKAQWFGDVVRYTQRGTIFFKNAEDTGDQRLPMVFNDAGKGFISGTR